VDPNRARATRAIFAVLAVALSACEAPSEPARVGGGGVGDGGVGDGGVATPPAPPDAGAGTDAGAVPGPEKPSAPAPAEPAPPACDDAPITDLVLREVALYQGVKVTLARDGEAVAPSAPIVAGRDALVRAFVQPRPEWVARELVVRVQIGEGAP